MLAQFVSLVVASGGHGEPGPLQYSLSTHILEHLPYRSAPNCSFEASTAAGDRRAALTGIHIRAEDVRTLRAHAARRLHVRWGRRGDDLTRQLRRTLVQALAP